MNATKYLLVKYIPDVHRFEPRNIGVILWSPLGVEARFVAEHPTRPGEVDGRSIPNFVTSASAYKQWVRYWRDAISAAAIQPLRGGELVSASSPVFIEALQQTSRGNFAVVDAGSILDAVNEEELPTVANQLFAQLVESTVSEEPRDLGFEELCDQLLERTQLTKHRNFHNRYPVKYTVRGIEEEYVFSHALANGTLERLYQRFPIPKRAALIQKNRDATAWSLEHLLEDQIITSDKIVILMDATPEQQAQTEVDKTIRLLASMSRIVNIHNESDVLAEFETAAQLPQH